MEPEVSMTAKRMRWERPERPPPKVDPMDALAAFLLRVSPQDQDLVEAYKLGKARKSAKWANYGAGMNNEPEPYPTLPDGPEEEAIPGLALAIRIRAARFSKRREYREEWRP